jgi:glycosyltransferase involved in cell wall biosynthesis
MNIALYYPWVYLKGGAERTLLQLMSRSRHRWTLFTNHYEPESTFPGFAEHEIVVLNEVSVRRTVGSVAGAASVLLRQTLDLRSRAALIVVSEGIGNLVALRADVPTSCICLTPLKLAYDPIARARYFNGASRPHYRLAIGAYAAFERPLWKRYRRVFCNSEETRRRLLAAGLVEPTRVEVAHHGVDTELFRPTERRERFFLVPGRIMWQKNIELAVAAWKRFRPEPDGWRLVVAGMVDRKSRSYLDMLRQLAGGRSDVSFVESPSDAELLKLYQTCHAVLFPASNEDWGLVPLEAMACGKGVVAVDRGGPRESVLDGLTGYLRPDHPDAFASAIETLAALPSVILDEVAQLARSRAQEFSWQPFVARIDEHVEEIAAPALSGVAAPRLEAIV